MSPSRLFAVALALLLASGAGAETYTLLAGEVVDEASGASEPLTGSFDATLIERPPPEPGRLAVELSELDARSLRVEDFAFRTGDRLLGPADPISHDGLLPLLYLQLANQIQLLGDRVALALFRSGGEVVAASDDTVTFRFVELESRSGRAVGRVGDTDLPRRLEISGRIREIDQSFEIHRGICGLPPPPGVGIPGSGEFTIINLDTGSLFSTSSGTIAIDDVTTPSRVTAPAPLARTLDSGVTLKQAPVMAIDDVTFFGRISVPATLEDPLEAGGAGYVAPEVGARLQLLGDGLEANSVVQASELALEPEVAGRLGPVTAALAPTLEDVGVTAPDGADVRFEDGVLTVETDGDLFVDGLVVDVPGLDALVLLAAGDVFVAGVLELPPGVSLRIEAGGNIEIEGEVRADTVDIRADDVEIGDGTGPIGPPGLCLGSLVPRHRETRELGSFSFVASAARPVAIDVKPWRTPNRIYPARRQLVPVVLLGSDSLDVGDVDATSLRLGDGEAPPLGRRGRPWVFRVDADRDAVRDLLGIFDSADAEIAYGDRLLCLTAETREGELLEGCDAIDTRPAWMGRRRPGVLRRRR
ncbi:MAG: hypothetical protein QNK04_09895 [Myxococcota bacterium]|nr:hypothetical protein [Myxococcota bacterium]